MTNYNIVEEYKRQQEENNKVYAYFQSEDTFFRVMKKKASF